MSEPRPRYYIVRHVVPLERGICFHDAEQEIWNPDPIGQCTDFERHLADILGPDATVIAGPHQDQGASISSDYLVTWRGTEELPRKIPGATIRRAAGEIFEAIIGLFHATHEQLTPLNGEVLTDSFEGDHATKIADINRDLHRRIAQFVRRELRRQGLSARLVSEILPTLWIHLLKQPIREWTWETLQRAFDALLAPLQDQLCESPARWYVEEVLVRTGEPGAPEPRVGGGLILDVCSAIPEAAGDWTLQERLVRAHPLWAHAARRNPEQEVVRNLEEGEVFVAERATAWMSEGKVLWLRGEIATELTANRHGEIVVGMLDDVYKDIAQFILDRAFDRAPELSSDDYWDRTVETVDTLLDDLSPEELWYHEVPGIVNELISLVLGDA